MDNLDFCVLFDVHREAVLYDDVWVTKWTFSKLVHWVCNPKTFLYSIQ